MTQLTDGGLELRYTPPAGVTELEFLSDSEATRHFWRDQVRSTDDCARIDGIRVLLDSSTGCRTAILHVKPRLMGEYATYEAALPMGSVGVIGYTGHYLTASTGHDLRWRWTAPSGGYVLYQGKVETTAVETLVPAAAVDEALSAPDTAKSRSTLGGGQYIYFGHAEAAAVHGGTLVHDPALDPGRLQLIRETLTSAMRSLGTAYGRWPDGPVGVVVTTTEDPGFQGDVTDGRMMSLRLSKLFVTAGPVEPTMRFIDHEVTHWWNMGVFQSDDRQPWLHEGHADWVALLLTRQQGANADQAADANGSSRVVGKPY